MERWAGKNAVVTGASSGIGQAIVRDLVKNGVNVVIMARQMDLLQKLKDEMSSAKAKIYPLKVDLNEELEILEAFSWIANKLGPIHILINNAAVNIMSDTSDAIMEEWRTMFNVNVLAVGSCIRELIKSVKTHNTEHAHIINISSIVAHRILDIPRFYVYTATKNALNSILLGIKRELTVKAPNIVVSSVSPGYVKETELFRPHKEFTEDMVERIKHFPGIIPTDISKSVMHVLSHPPNVRVDDIIIQSNMSLA